MDKACDGWETAYPPDTPGTWLKFKQFFTKKFFNYQNHQASLSDAGAANSIVSHTAVVIPSTLNLPPYVLRPKPRMNNSPS